MNTKSGPRRPEPVRRLRGRPGPGAGRQPSGSLEDVRTLIFGAPSVSEVLPEAITQATEERLQAMTVALEPVVTESIRTFARRESELFGEILSPTIGAAVRKAVADAIRALMDRFNEALERSLSLRSIQWRIEARRTGRPFAEVTLLRTLVYRVEQVFLIHAESGLVLQHVVALNAPSADPDQVGAMIDAIDAFLREAFRPQPAGVHVSELMLGDVTVCIDWAPPIVVAAVVRGVGPRHLFDTLREARERIYLAHRTDLAEFVSDVRPFERARPSLEACLHEQHQAPPRRAQVILSVLAVLAAIALTIFSIAHFRNRAEVARATAAYESALAAEPGIVVSDVTRVDGSYRVTGFRDPVAADPAQIVKRAGLQPADLRFSPIQSLDPAVIRERIERALLPPAGLTVRLVDGGVRLAGEAPAAWIERAVLQVGPLAGGAHVDARELRPSETMALLRATAAALEAVELRYAPGDARVRKADRNDVVWAGALARQLLQLAASARIGVCISSVGVADESGSAARNRALAASRAAAGAVALRGQRVPPDALQQAAGDRGDTPSTRATRFRVRLRPAANAAACEAGS